MTSGSDKEHGRRAARWTRWTPWAIGVAVCVVLALVAVPRFVIDPPDVRPASDPSDRTRAENDAAPVDPLPGERSAAEPVPTRAVELRSPPDLALLNPRRAAAEAFAGGDLTSALELYRQQAEADPADAELLNNTGQVLTRLNRAEEALEYFDEALALDPDRWLFRFNRAAALAALYRWPDAIEEYRRAATSNPTDYPTRFNLSLALQKAGDHESAVVELQHAATLAPGDPSVHLALGSSYERLGRWTDAADSYRQYIQMAPGAPDVSTLEEHVARLIERSGTS